MGLAELLLGKENPFAQWTGQNQNYLGALGAGIGSGQNIQSGLSNGLQMVPQAKQMDLEARRQQEADAKVLAQTNATQAWLQQNHPDLAQMVEAGMPVGEAWNIATQRMSPQQGAKPTDDIQEYEYALQSGFQGSFSDWMTKSKSPQTVVNNTVGATDEFYGALDKAAGGAVIDTIAAGNNARSSQIRVQELERLLKTAPQGVVGGATQLAGAIGLPIDGVDEVQAATALINQMVPLQRAPGSGPMSDKDLELFKQSLPAIINQPGGNQKIIAAIKGINEYTIAQAEIAQAVANREITPPEGRRLASQVPNPLAGFGSPLGGSNGGLDPVTAADELLKSGKY